MKKYHFHDFAECLENICDNNFYEKWETNSYKEDGTDSIYEVDFMNDDEKILFTKTIVVDNEDGSCYTLGEIITPAVPFERGLNRNS